MCRDGCLLTSRCQWDKVCTFFTLRKLQSLKMKICETELPRRCSAGHLLHLLHLLHLHHPDVLFSCCYSLISILINITFNRNIKLYCPSPAVSPRERQTDIPAENWLQQQKKINNLHLSASLKNNNTTEHCLVGWQTETRLQQHPNKAGDNTGTPCTLVKSGWIIGLFVRKRLTRGLGPSYPADPVQRTQKQPQLTDKTDAASLAPLSVQSTAAEPRVMDQWGQTRWTAFTALRKTDNDHLLFTIWSI